MIAGLFIFIALWLILLWFEQISVYKPEVGDPAPLESATIEVEEVSFIAEDGVLLHGWWIPAKDAKGTMLYCHGNAQNLGARHYVCEALHELGVNVFIFDYRGYGKSRGRPSERGTYRDARAAYEFVRVKHDDSDHPPVVIYGASLGGAIAAQLALEKPSRGLILENTFTSVPDMGERIYPWLPIRLFGRIRYNTRAKISRIGVPLLIAHTREDGLVPYDMGEALFKSARHPKTFLQMRGPHGEGTWAENPALLREIAAFVGKVLQ